ncbi:YjbQ family protein [Streptomyces sp. G7(2002)]|uniref:YjbQ family protein n=1 Tax=Streptomyces sp. G7(2002) TaxID=2971798 RepID=UPI00237E4A19|nr:YjbQ family protein [Streptomyces sp. G7(2002)]WDT58456.1 YjbQ family protein [Streptomyces sp. G7(2002)]
MAGTFTTRTITIGATETMHDLTNACSAFLREAAHGRNGLLNVFTLHPTSGLAVIETGAGSDDDLLAALRGVLPADDRWGDRHGGPGHGSGHVLPALVPPHATLPVVEGELELGASQSVVLVNTDRDGPERQVRLSFLG